MKFELRIGAMRGADGPAQASVDAHDHTPTMVYGTNRADLIVTGGGPQVVIALNEDDTVYAGGGPDRIEGGNGKDALYGQGGPDKVFGGNGDDYLHGGGGPDALSGGNGDDVLIGCMAADILTGGRGADIFVFRSASEAPAHGTGDEHVDDGGGHDGGDGGHDGCGGTDAGMGQETITDFQPGTDLIDLSAIGTVFGLADGATANAVWTIQQGEDTMLLIDTNGSIEGDHPAEMSILLMGVAADTLTVSDFIF